MRAADLNFEQLLSNADMYQFLALFLSLPADEMVTGLQDGSLLQDVINIFEELAVPEDSVRAAVRGLDEYGKKKAGSKELLSALRTEYTRLFRHPEKPAVHIYEALFLWKPRDNKEPMPSLFISPAAMDAERCYARAGFERGGEVNESADYFVTQLEFMMLLYRKLADAKCNDNHQEYDEFILILEEFAKLHLCRWALPFFKKCEEVCENETLTAFWRIGVLFFEHFLPQAENCRQKQP